MATIVTRIGKGSALTYAEADANFTNLNTELGQKLVAANNLSDLTNTATARTNLGLATVASSGLASDLSFGSQTANAFFAAPNGVAGTPTFRAIVAADIPTLNQNTTGSAATLTTSRTIAMSGDVVWSVSFNGSSNVTATATIQPNVVTNADLVQVATATFKGRATAGTGNVEDLTGTQATALLDTFTSSLKGLAPASGGGTTNFLRADGTWAAPPGGGGGVSDGDKGDITVSGTGTVWTIDPAAVTYSKIQNVSAASRLLGRGSAGGSGSPEEITPSGLLSMSGTTLSAVPGVHVTMPVASGAFVTAHVNGTATATLAAASNRMDFYPFIPARTITINELAIDVTTGVASSLAHAGIYSDSSGVPGSLIVGTSSTLDCSTTGVKNQAVSSTTLTAGTIYWLAVLTNSTQTLRAIPVAALVPLSISATGGTVNTIRRATQTFGALPSTAPSTTLTGNTVAQMVRMQIA